MTYFVAFVFPVVIFFVFRALPFRLAIPITLVSGYLLLPARWAIDLPVVPPLDKASIPMFVSLAMVLLFSARQSATGTPRDHLAPDRTLLLEGWIPGLPWARMAILLILLMPTVTTLSNLQPVTTGNFTLPGLGMRDAYNLTVFISLPLIALMLARRYLSDEAGHRTMLLVLAVAGLAYSLPALVEVRLSPQFHVWVYGYFQHSWIQHLRSDGFRPLVVLPHGLELGLFLCLACLAVMGYLRAIDGDRKILFFLLSLYLLVVLFLAKSLGALLIGAVLLPVVLLLGARMQLLVAALTASMLLTYPALRTVGISPLQLVANAVEPVHADRAASLSFRLDVERRVLARANEKPLVGWGGWGRENVLNDGVRRFAIRDGTWLILIGQYGWIAYLAMFSLLTFPIFALCALAWRRPVSLATSGLAVILAANLIDLIPNSGLMPMTWMIAGALLGRVEALSRPAAEAARPAPSAPRRDTTRTSGTVGAPSGASARGGGAAVQRSDGGRDGPSSPEGSRYTRFPIRRGRR